MKITLTKKQIEKNKKRRDKANKGCDRCPCCGSYICAHKLSVQEKIIGLFHVYYVDLYWCDNCGAEWQSDKYRR